MSPQFYREIGQGVTFLVIATIAWNLLQWALGSYFIYLVMVLKVISWIILIFAAICTSINIVTMIRNRKRKGAANG